MILINHFRFHYQILIYPIIILSIVKIPACSRDVNRRAILCCNRNILYFLHTEEELADIQIKLYIQFIVAVNVNSFDHRIYYHLFCFNGSTIIKAWRRFQRQ